MRAVHVAVPSVPMPLRAGWWQGWWLAICVRLLAAVCPGQWRAGWRLVPRSESGVRFVVY